MSARRNRPASGRARFFFVLGLLFALGTQVQAQTWTINWTKYDNTVPANSDGSSTNGKIPLGGVGKGDSNYAFAASVILDGSTYKMWYTGYDGTNYRIYYATSPNGLDWTKYDNTIPANSDSNSTGGRIPLGTSGKGDAKHTLGPSVIKDDSPPIYKMWYTGHDFTNYRIYYATSSNGLDWTKYDNGTPDNSNGSSTNGKIPLGIAGRGDAFLVIDMSVIKDGSTYKMWYGGHDGSNIRIYYATSSNGLEWTKLDNTVPAASDGASSNGRIPRGATGGDTVGVRSPQVIKVGNTYRMWYAGDNGIYRIYHATSSNGLTWTKYNNTVPPDSDTTNSNSRVGLGTAGKGDDVYLNGSPVILVGDRDYKMWYAGYDGANYRIYHATGLGPPQPGTIFTFK